MSLHIKPVDKHTFNEAVRLIMLFMKEHKHMMINRVEAQRILQQPFNKTYVLVVNHNVRGVYVYEDSENIYTIKAFILDSLVRQKKTGYALWRHMVQKLNDRPALISVIENNKNVKGLIKKRGKYIGTYLDEDGETIEFYNLSFKGQK